MTHESEPCSACTAGRTGVFAGLSPEQCQQLTRARLTRSYRRGQIVFYAGDELNYVWCIHSGHVKLSKIGRTRQEVVIRFLGPGDITGYRPILASETSAADAECVVASELCLIPRMLFLQFIQESPRFSSGLLEKLAKDLRESEERWIEHASEPVEFRVSRFIGQLLGQTSPVAGKNMSVSITVPRKEIAHAAGTTPSTLSRLLAKFEERGLIRLGPRDILVLNTGYFKEMP